MVGGRSWINVGCWRWCDDCCCCCCCCNTNRGSNVQSWEKFIDCKCVVQRCNHNWDFCNSSHQSSCDVQMKRMHEITGDLTDSKRDCHKQRSAATDPLAENFIFFSAASFPFRRCSRTTTEWSIAGIVYEQQKKRKTPVLYRFCLGVVFLLVFCFVWQCFSLSLSLFVSSTATRANRDSGEPVWRARCPCQRHILYA